MFQLPYCTIQWQKSCSGGFHLEMTFYTLLWLHCLWLLKCIWVIDASAAVATDQTLIHKQSFHKDAALHPNRQFLPHNIWLCLSYLIIAILAIVCSHVVHCLAFISLSLYVFYPFQQFSDTQIFLQALYLIQKT